MEPMDNTVDTEYGAESIKVLKGLDAVRKRPGMYIGDTDDGTGLHHMVFEIVDNSIDEAMAGHCNQVQVILHPDESVTVIDNGRGIPTDMHEEGISAAEVIMTTLHAGGKFGEEGGGYKVSGGLHGVGVSVVNALSTHLTADVYRDGYHWQQSFQLGVPDAPVARMEASDERGTTITFYASKEIFETTHYSWDTLANRFREMAFLNKGLKITLIDERPESKEEDDDSDVSETFLYHDGLIDYVKYLTGSKEVIHPSVVAIDAVGEENRISLEVAMQWNSSFNESVHTFANTINTHEGGTHEEGFRAALTNTVNKWGETWALIKKREDRVSGDDIREGLTAIISVKLADPQFEGQTKTKLGNTEARSFVQKVVNDLLSDWFEKNPAEGRDIVRKSQAAANARLAARKARDLARSRKGLLSRSGEYGKLADCSSTEPSECEVFIVEGDSAGGSAKGGRDPRTQAILPIRGKILNVEKARLDRILQNKEVAAIFNVLGTGVQDDFDLDKLRYHKIVLMADADVDGAHIRTLLLTLLFRFMKPLIHAGHVYLAQPPLFRIRWTNSPHELAYSDTERDTLRDDGLAAGKKLPNVNPIQRYKGLGEMDHTDLWDTTMDPEKRTLLQVTLEDAAAADNIFSVLMGEDVEPRRAFIQRHAKDVRFLDI